MNHITWTLFCIPALDVWSYHCLEYSYNHVHKRVCLIIIVCHQSVLIKVSKAFSELWILKKTFLLINKMFTLCALYTQNLLVFLNLFSLFYIYKIYLYFISFQIFMNYLLVIVLETFVRVWKTMYTTYMLLMIWWILSFVLFFVLS